jgi:hypothetical protein
VNEGSWPHILESVPFGMNRDFPDEPSTEPVHRLHRLICTSIAAHRPAEGKKRFKKESKKLKEALKKLKEALATHLCPGQIGSLACQLALPGENSQRPLVQE